MSLNPGSPVSVVWKAAASRKGPTRSAHVRLVRLG